MKQIIGIDEHAEAKTLHDELEDLMVSEAFVVCGFQCVACSTSYQEAEQMRADRPSKQCKPVNRVCLSACSLIVKVKSKQVYFVHECMYLGS